MSNYSLAFTEEEITIGDVQYILREADGQATIDFENAKLNSIKFGDKGPTGFSNLSNVQILLLSKCLFIKEGNKPVAKETILKWPGRIQTELFERAKKISNLDAPKISFNELLVEALNNPEAPATAEQIFDWIVKLEDPKFDPVKKLFEDNAKK